jgi:hypothetical protein
MHGWYGTPSISTGPRRTITAPTSAKSLSTRSGNVLLIRNICNIFMSLSSLLYGFIGYMMIYEYIYDISRKFQQWIFTPVNELQKWYRPMEFRLRVDCGVLFPRRTQGWNFSFWWPIIRTPANMRRGSPFKGGFCACSIGFNFFIPGLTFLYPQTPAVTVDGFCYPVILLGYNMI